MGGQGFVVKLQKLLVGKDLCVGPNLLEGLLPRPGGLCNWRLRLYGLPAGGACSPPLIQGALIVPTAFQDRRCHGPSIADKMDDEGAGKDLAEKPQAKGRPRRFGDESRSIVVLEVPLDDLLKVTLILWGEVSLSGEVVWGVRESPVPDGVSFVGFKDGGQVQRSVVRTAKLGGKKGIRETMEKCLQWPG
jgi:hypothetical protein